MLNLLPFIIFLIILSLLILVHEAGHFIVAIKSGIAVEEFGFGIPPRIWGKKIGKTIYSLNLFPFGGFIRVKGEDLEDASTTERDNDSFAHKKPKIRALVLVAGIVMNIILGSLLFQVVLMSSNYVSSPLMLFTSESKKFKFPFGSEKVLSTVITYVQEGSPAEKAGITFGDFIKQTNINSITDLQGYLGDKGDKEVFLTVGNLNDNTTRIVAVTPQFDEKAGRAVIGVGLDSVALISYRGLQKPLAGFLHGVNVTLYSLDTFKGLFSTSIKEKSLEPVSAGFSGPVGIFGVVSAVVDLGGTRAILSLTELTALLSFSLALFNILPLPALDGGRLLFVVVEGVTRKKVNPKIEATIHKIGMLVLLVLMVVITAKDLFSLR
ncbi:M50 family metallopeptidase [Candidatus Parcubacteria bacterium]|nr:M50 family metallopeptidase [Patescibacteria group bacterium]MCG2689229.1 M50 family metallopeptidase [Candidatus Parcubacteria bacterium]